MTNNQRNFGTVLLIHSNATIFISWCYPRICWRTRNIYYRMCPLTLCIWLRWSHQTWRSVDISSWLVVSSHLEEGRGLYLKWSSIQFQLSDEVGHLQREILVVTCRAVSSPLDQEIHRGATRFSALRTPTLVFVPEEASHCLLNPSSLWWFYSLEHLHSRLPRLAYHHRLDPLGAQNSNQVHVGLHRFDQWESLKEVQSLRRYRYFLLETGAFDGGTLQMPEQER